ncbi:2613_t:CDS:1, partial [Cetraspora pellucida]
CAAGETCQNGTCVSPGCNPQCSDGYLNGISFNSSVPATGNCINSTCYLCISCVPTLLCSRLTNAVCVNTTNCNDTSTCNCCAPAPQMTSLPE